MPIGCVISFDDNRHGTYFAGQVVTGKVTLRTEKVKQVKAVVLNIRGFAHTCWVRSQHEHLKRSFTGHEDYLESKTFLLGTELNQMINIDPGVHTYNFACHLPTICPTSFEGFYGYIRYTVKVILERPWKFDETFTRGFTVIKTVDLNYESPTKRVPASSEIQRTFCCGPCRTAPLILTVSLAQSGYVPGQVIPVSVLVTNDSNVPVDEIKVSLAMFITYFSQHPFPSVKQDRLTVTKVKGESVLRQCTKNFSFDLPVPATPPTCLNHCRLVQITYQVVVEAKVKEVLANEVVCIPVTIGNVPIMNVIQHQPTSNVMMPISFRDDITFESTAAGNAANYNGSGNDFENEMHVVLPAPSEDVNAIQIVASEAVPTSAATSRLWSSEHKIPPPSYEEATHMSHANITAEEAHDYGQSDFAPRYPVFNIPIAPNPNESNRGIFSEGFEPSKSTWL